MNNMKNITFFFLMFCPFIISAQETGDECVEYEPIEMYNLRKAIIDQQNLDTWPSIVEIKNLQEIKTERADSLILYIAETNQGDKLRLTNTSDLSKFAETDYKNDCRQEGTILTDLNLNSIDLSEMKAEIRCRQSQYAVLKIKN